MEAIKQIIKVPKDHRIRVNIPSYIPEDELVEMVFIVKKRPDSFEQKIKELKEATKDKLFLKDLSSTLEDFKVVDLQGWDNGI